MAADKHDVMYDHVWVSDFEVQANVCSLLLNKIKKTKLA